MMINTLSGKPWLVLVGILSVACPAAADDSLKEIPRIDVHAHCGNPEQMERYVRISDSLRQEYGQHLVAWVDLSFRRNKGDSADAYLEAAFTKYQQRFLPCLHDAIRDGIQYTPQDLVAWQQRGVVGLKIWVGVSDAIDKPEHDPLFAKMVEIGMPGASIHIAQPYPTSWCEDHIQFWRAQNAWERVLDRRGLALPKETLEKIYYRNALKIYPAARDTIKASGYASHPESGR